MRRKTVLASIIGNFIEFYDFSLYGFLAPVFSRIFFPSKSAFISLLLTYGTFAISFFARPIGAIIFGRIGDKYGRTISLSVSIILITIPTILISFLPTFNDIGLLAPFCLIVLRFLQGISTGGEYNGAFVYALENNPEKPGLIGGLVTAGAASGMLLSSFLVSYLGIEKLEILWRYLFLFGGTLGLIGFFCRKYISESPEYINLKNTTEKKKEIIFNQNSLIILAIGGASGALFYIQFVYFKVFSLSYLNLSPTFMDILMNISLVFYIIMLVVAGNVSDLIGHKKMMIMTSFGILLFSVPLFLLSSFDKIIFVCLFQGGFSFLTACFIAPSHITMKKLAPRENTYFFISTYFSIGICCIGGTAPMISHSLVEYTKNPGSVGYILILCSVLFLLVSFKKLWFYSNKSNTFSPIKM